MKNFKEFKKSPIFVLIIGVSASGKNTWFEKNMKLNLIDLDKIILKIHGSKTNGDNRNILNKSISLAQEEMLEYLKTNTSFAQVTVGSNLNTIKNKLTLAKEYGFKTKLIHVDVDPKVAIERNKKRVKNGDIGATIPEEKIIRNNERIRDVFNTLKTTTLVDEAEQVIS